MALIKGQVARFLCARVEVLKNSTPLRALLIPRHMPDFGLISRVGLVCVVDV